MLQLLYVYAVEDTQSSAIESLVKVKERELALALMRVAELTRQLEQLRQGQLDGVLVDSTSAHAMLLDRNPEVWLETFLEVLFAVIFERIIFLKI